MKSIIVLNIFLGMWCQVYALPCSLSNPNAANCFYAKMWDLVQLDPLVVKEVNIDQRLSDTVYINAKVSDSVMVGFSNSSRDQYIIDFDKLFFDATYTLPHVSLKMNYNVNGQLLTIPLKSQGHMEGTFTDMKARFIGNLTRVNIGGKEVFQVGSDMEHMSTIGNGSIKMRASNFLLQASADLIANFFNANTRLVLDTINPIYIATARRIYLEYFNAKLMNTPASEILVD